MFRKSQISFEIMVVLGFVLGITIFFLVSGLNAAEPFVKDKVYGAGEKLVEEVETSVRLGEHNKRNVFIDFPDNVISYSYANNDIIVEAEFDEGRENLYFEVPVKVVGEIDGRLKIEYISNTSNSGYVCLYREGDRENCCFDFDCTLK